MPEIVEIDTTTLHIVEHGECIAIVPWPGSRCEQMALARRLVEGLRDELKSEGMVGQAREKIATAIEQRADYTASREPWGRILKPNTAAAAELHALATDIREGRFDIPLQSPSSLIDESLIDRLLAVKEKLGGFPRHRRVIDEAAALLSKLPKAGA